MERDELLEMAREEIFDKVIIYQFTPLAENCNQLSQ